MAARAEASGLAGLVPGENVRALVDQPFGRGRGRCAENDLQAGHVQHVEGAVQPDPVEAVARGLDPAPGELADAHEADAEIRHFRGILGPAFLRPVFGIVADAKHVGPLVLA